MPSLIYKLALFALTISHRYPHHYYYVSACPTPLDNLSLQPIPPQMKYLTTQNRYCDIFS